MAAQREWFEKDYYKVLGVVPTASEKEITRAYRKLAKENHPDTNPGTEERFKEISAAYDVIGDAEKRKEYDEVRAHGPVGGFGGVPGGGGGGTFRMEDMGDLGDLFGGLFGGGAGRTRTTQRGPQRGRRHGGAAPPVVPGRGARRHDLGQRAPGGALLELPRQRSGAGHVDAHLPALRGDGEPQRQPGAVLPQHGLPGLHGPGDAVRHALPGVPRDRAGAQGACGQGPHPGRGRGRPAHQGQGTGRARTGHGAGRRPLRGRPRGEARGLRAQRPQPDHHGADHVSQRRRWGRRSRCRRSTAR